MPKSDTDPGETSQPLYDYLSNPASYAGPNVVQFHTAYAKADYSQADTGHVDLVHAKYMVIDPFGAEPVVIHGSPNWTYSGLMDDDSNDENLLILRHRAIASIFYAHFKRITGALPGRTDNWLEINRVNGRSVINLWLTDTNTYALDYIPALPNPTWTPLITGVTGTAGRISHVTNALRGFYRGRRE
jgi:phosphatidylserine/phosphatidylglycerophosphate/cardiolipin synthase-like enzyme